MMFEIIRNSGLTKNGTFDAGIFQPVKRNSDGRVFVHYQNQMVEASRLAGQFPWLRNATGLPTDAWKDVSEKVKGYAKKRTSGYADLINAGCMIPVNDVGTMVYYQTKHNGLDDAVMSMTGKSNKRNEEFKFDVDATPLPVIHKKIEESWRVMAAMQRGGFSFETIGVTEAFESVLRKTEETVFIGDFAFGGATAYGYTNSGNRQTGSLTYDWSAAATTAANIWADILVAQKLISTNLVNWEAGKAIMYVPVGWKNHFNDLFTTGDRLTLAEKLATVEWLDSVKEVSYMKANNIVIAFMQPIYANIVRGLAPQVIMYNSPDGMDTTIEAIAIESPLITDDYNGKKGIFNLAYSG